MAGGCGEDARIRVDFAADGSTSSPSSSRPAAAVALHAQPCRGRASTRAARRVSCRLSRPASATRLGLGLRLRLGLRRGLLSPPKAALSRRPSAVAPDDGRRSQLVAASYEYAYQIRRVQWQTQTRTDGMHVAIERNSWRLPQDDVVQVVNPKSKIKEMPDELAYAGLSDGQYWRSVILALLVIGLVIAGIASAICTYGFVDELLYWSGTRLRLEQILGTTSVFPSRLPATWVSDRAFVFQNDDGDLSSYDPASDTVDTLIANCTLNQLNVKRYKCSYDLKYILLESNINRVFKNAYTSHVTVYTVGNGHQSKLHLNESEVDELELQSADWAGRTNDIVFVKDNDIYVKFEASSSHVRLTDTGVPGVVYNGIPDWLYQEEIFADTSGTAYWPSVDGRFLLYATFNDSAVQTLDYPWIDDDADADVAEAGGDAGDAPKLTPTRSVRYPTPGTAIPKVELRLIEIRAGDSARTSVRVDAPRQLIAEDHYLVSAGWVNSTNERFSAVWTSRARNLTVVSYYEAPSWKCVDEKNHAETAPERMWLETQPHPVFAADGRSYLLLAPVPNGSRYFTQINHVAQSDRRVRVRVISCGAEVFRIVAWDTVNHVVWYEAADEENGGERHLYTVNDQTSGDVVRLDPRCVTCDLRYSAHYQNCTHFTAYLASANPLSAVEWYALQCNDRPVATAAVHRASDHSMRASLYTGRAKLEELRAYALPIRRFESVPLAGGYSARVELSMPPSWRPELRDAAFPVIVRVDGKPNSQLVSTEWKTDWSLYMSASKGVVYVKVDVRGSRGQSTPDLYQNLGVHEIDDQINVVRTLLNRHKYLDSHRIGVWGWGYGGYATALLVSSQHRMFKCGVAVAPVADWSYYNSAFAEKVFGLKSNANRDGNAKAKLKERSAFIGRDSFYLMQGLADQSVPFQHGFMWANALTQSKTLFKHQVYANEGFALENVRLHAFRSMENHFTQCLALEEDASPNHEG